MLSFCVLRFVRLLCREAMRSICLFCGFSGLKPWQASLERLKYDVMMWPTAKSFNRTEQWKEKNETLWIISICKDMKRIDERWENKNETKFDFSLHWKCSTNKTKNKNKIKNDIRFIIKLIVESIRKIHWRPTVLCTNCKRKQQNTKTKRKRIKANKNEKKNRIERENDLSK